LKHQRSNGTIYCVLFLTGTIYRRNLHLTDDEVHFQVHPAAEGKKARGDLIPTIILWVMEELNVCGGHPGLTFPISRWDDSN